MRPLKRIFPEGVGNWRRRRFLETGRGFRAERATIPQRKRGRSR